MKLIIAGNKTFSDYVRFKNELDEFLIKHRHDEAELILTGGEPGTEVMAAQFAKENEIPLEVFDLDEATFGDESAAVRDAQMIDNATALIVFWDGVSSGKQRKQDLAKKKDIILEVVNYSKPQN